MAKPPVDAPWHTRELFNIYGSSINTRRFLKTRSPQRSESRTLVPSEMDQMSSFMKQSPREQSKERRAEGSEEESEGESALHLTLSPKHTLPRCPRIDLTPESVVPEQHELRRKIKL